MNYLLNTRYAQAAFSRAASTYDQAAVLGQEIEQRMLERLDFVRLEPKRIVDLGCATGHLTRLLAQRYPTADVYGVDMAYGMAHYAKGAIFICADAQQLPLPDRSVDLIISNLTLHWCNDLEVVFKEWKRILAPEGLLMFSTFGPDTLQELRASWAQVDEAHPHVHAFWDMHDIGDTLMKCGFADPVLDAEHITMIYKDVYGLMRDLKQMGAHNATEGRQRGLTGKDQFQQFLAAYENWRTVDGVLPATYEVVYGHAWVPQEVSEISIPIQHIARRSNLG